MASDNVIVSSAWLKTLCEMFAHEGVNTEQLLEHAELGELTFNQADRYFPIQVLGKLWDSAVELSNNPYLGLNVQLCDRLLGFYQIGYGMSACATLKDAVELMTRYFAVVSSGVKLGIKSDPAGVWLCVDVLYSNTTYRTRLGFGCLMILRLFSWLTRRDIYPLQLDWAFDAQDAKDTYQDIFNVAPRFNQPQTQILISASDLNLPIPTASAEMYAVQKQYLETQVARLEKTSMRAKVFVELFQNIKQGEPRRKELAERMCISDRTLQRKLKSEGTSFNEILDDVRYVLADHHLSNSALSLQEIPSLLGFNDIRSFYRFSQRRLGMSPGVYRNQNSAEEIS